MRVALVTHRFPPDAVGGVERTTESLARHLRRLGDDVSVVTRRAAAAPRTPRSQRQRRADGTVVYRFVGGDVSTAQFLRHQQRLELLFTIALLERKPDVVHFNHLIGLSPGFIEIAQRFGSAVVLSLHDFFFACPLAHLQKFSGASCSGPDGGRECARTCFAGEGPSASMRWGLRTTYFRQLLRKAPRVICPSSFVADYFVAFGADASRVRVVPNGVADEILSQSTGYRTSSAQQDELRLAYAGTVVPHKGVHLILEALKIARLGRVRLIVLGETVAPAYTRTLRAMAEAIPGVELRLYGGYALEDLPRLLAGVDCLVMPSEVPETGARTAREALACGVPVVASRLGALPELVTEGVNGLMFEARQPARLAAALHRFSTDEQLRRRLRLGACATEIPSASEHCSTVRQVYEEALGEPPQHVSPGESQGERFLLEALHEVGFDHTPSTRSEASH